MLLHLAGLSRRHRRPRPITAGASTPHWCVSVGDKARLSVGPSVCREPWAWDWTSAAVITQLAAEHPDERRVRAHVIGFLPPPSGHLPPPKITVADKVR